MMLNSYIFKSKALTSFLDAPVGNKSSHIHIRMLLSNKRKKETKNNNATELPHNDNIDRLKMGHKESEKNITNLLKQLCSLAYSKNYSCLWGEQFLLQITTHLLHYTFAASNIKKKETN